MRVLAIHLLNKRMLYVGHVGGGSAVLRARKFALYYIGRLEQVRCCNRCLVESSEETPPVPIALLDKSTFSVLETEPYLIKINPLNQVCPLICFSSFTLAILLTQCLRYIST